MLQISSAAVQSLKKKKSTQETRYVISELEAVLGVVGVGRDISCMNELELVEKSFIYELDLVEMYHV